MKDTFFLSNEEVLPEPFEYRFGGLEGVYLLNGVSRETHDGEEYVTVKNVDGLHRAIGLHLVLNRKALAPKEIRFLRNTLDMTQAELAEKLGNTSQSVARWEKGECEIPGAAEKLLRVLYLISMMSKEQIESLIEKIEALLVGTELDQMDASQDAVQLHFFDNNWEEKKAA